MAQCRRAWYVQILKLEAAAGMRCPNGMHLSPYRTTADNTAHTALQSLPRQDRRRLQRDKERSRRHPLQASRQPLHREAYQRPSRAREIFALPRGVPHTSEGKRCEEEQGEGRGYADVPEAAAKEAKGRADDQCKRQQAGDYRADCVRDYDLEWCQDGV